MNKFIFLGPPGFDKKEQHRDFPWHWYLFLHNNLNKEKQMTKYCIKLISEVYFEFDYEGPLKDSCVPENYPDEIKALIMEEAKKLSDKNFYVGYCNERRDPGSHCSSSEELKFLNGNGTSAAAQPDFTDEELKCIKEEIKEMSVEESSAFLMNKYPGRFCTIRSEASLGNVKHGGFGVAGVFTPEDIEKMTASGCFIPATEEEKKERGNLYDHIVWGMLPIKMRAALLPEFIALRGTFPFCALIRKLSPEEEKEVLTHMERIECMTSLSDIIDYLKENNLPPFKEHLQEAKEAFINVSASCTGYEYTIWGLLPVKMREVVLPEFFALRGTSDFCALIMILSSEEQEEISKHLLNFKGQTLRDIIDYLKEIGVAPFNKPLETPAEKTGENNE